MFERLRSRKEQHMLLPHAVPIAETELCVAPTQINTSKCTVCSEAFVQKDVGVLVCPECGITTCSFGLRMQQKYQVTTIERASTSLILQYLQGIVANRESDPPHWVLDGTCKALAAKKLGLMEITVQDVANVLETLMNTDTGEKAKKFIKIRVRIFFLITKRELPTLTHSAVDHIKTIFTNVVCGPFKSVVQNKRMEILIIIRVIARCL